MYEIITELLTPIVRLNSTPKRSNIDSKIAKVATWKVLKRYFWMLVRWFWLNTIIKQQKQEQYMNLRRDPLDNPLTTRSIETGSELCIEQDPNCQFWCIETLDHVVHYGSFPIWIWNWCRSLEGLLTLLQYDPYFVPLDEHIICVWRTTKLLWRGSFHFPKGLNKSQQQLEKSHTLLLSSPDHLIVWAGYIASRIKRSHNMQILPPRAGWIY